MCDKRVRLFAGFTSGLGFLGGGADPNQVEEKGALEHQPEILQIIHMIL